MLHSDRAKLVLAHQKKSAGLPGIPGGSPAHHEPSEDSGSKNGVFQSALLAPLRVKDDLIGTLALVRPQSKAPYADEDKVFLQDLANRAALVIENARLYAAETQRAGELDAPTATAAS
jgi:GAF domain-containing protein